MTTMDASTRFNRNKDCSWSSLGTEVLILDMERRKSHRLTGAAAVVWHGAVDGLSVGEIVDRVCAEFEVEAEAAERDALVTLTNLLELGVIQLRG